MQKHVIGSSNMDYLLKGQWPLGKDRETDLPDKDLTDHLNLIKLIDLDDHQLHARIY